MTWAGLDLVERTGDETLATKHYEYDSYDVDLMLWQYAMGILEFANASHRTVLRNHPILEPAFVDTMNELVVDRHQQLIDKFHRQPSFRVQFEFLYNDKVFQIKKV